MSNVLIGIVGVVLFIGLALAGASFFGPISTIAVVEGKGSGIMRVLSTTAKAVTVRNREQETVTGGSPDSTSLVSDYLTDVPTNPLNGNPVMLVNATGTTSGGAAKLVVTKLTASTDMALCGYLDRQGGGSGTVQVLSALPTQPMGCAQAGFTVGAFTNGDVFAYASI